jgi:hypothetical protein
MMAIVGSNAVTWIVSPYCLVSYSSALILRILTVVV